MEDSNDFFPYYDADAFPLDEDMAGFLNNLNCTLSDFNEELVLPMSYSPELSQEINHQISDVDNDNVVYSESMIQDQDVGIYNTAINGGENFEDCLSQDQGRKFEAGPSQVNMENPPPADNNMESTDFSAHVNHPRWPPTARAKPFCCTYCEVLREIIHTNGVDFTTLEIHGRLGFICHGIRRQNIVVGFLPSNPEYQIIDFKKKSVDEIKSTLMQYCMERNQAGYVLVADPLSSYYETLSIGLDWTDDFNDDLPDNQNHATSVPDVEPANQKAPLTAQREKVGRLRLTDFSDYFHLPIDEASKLMGICPTVVKKICRRDGLNRWPHRKVKSIVKQISALRKNIDSGDEAFRRHTQANIDALLNEIVMYCGGIAPTSLIIE